MESQECTYCEEEFTFEWGDVYDSCDVLDGQYRHFNAVRCPHCGCENRW
jgi:hypothetical protein